MTLVNRRNNFLDGDIRVSLPDLLSELLDSVDRLTDLLLPALHLGNQSRDATAMARDYDGHAALDLIEQSRQMGLSLRSLHFAEPMAGIIGPKGSGILAETLARPSHDRLFQYCMVESTS